MAGYANVSLMTTNHAVYKIKREHVDILKRLTLELSVQLDRRVSQSDALYLTARYALKNMPEVVEGIKADIAGNAEASQGGGAPTPGPER